MGHLALLIVWAVAVPLGLPVGQPGCPSASLRPLWVRVPAFLNLVSPRDRAWLLKGGVVTQLGEGYTCQRDRW